MAKSSEAFRTISEVADWLGTPAHVLRFWESKFSQVKPVKRAGGRRYYRPADMELIGGIKRLLHDDGMTIKGVQKILREKGAKHVAALSQPLDGALPTETGSTEISPAIHTPRPELETVPDQPVEAETLSAPHPEPTEQNNTVSFETTQDTAQDDAKTGVTEDTAPQERTVDMFPETLDITPQSVSSSDMATLDTTEDVTFVSPTETTSASEPEAPVAPTQDTAPSEPMPAFGSARAQPEPPAEEAAEDETPLSIEPALHDSEPSTPLSEPAPATPSIPTIDVPADPGDGDIPPTPGLLTALLRADAGEIRANAVRIQPLLKRLEAIESGPADQSGL
jgi:DNA-binding transcriptional MerR regulator